MSLEHWQNNGYLVSPDLFHIEITPNPELMRHLTQDERERLYKKLPLVAKTARKLAAGMVKGVLKYPTDEWDREKWLDHLEEEIMDLANYISLMRGS